MNFEQWVWDLIGCSYLALLFAVLYLLMSP